MPVPEAPVQAPWALALIRHKFLDCSDMRAVLDFTGMIVRVGEGPRPVSGSSHHEFQSREIIMTHLSSFHRQTEASQLNSSGLSERSTLAPSTAILETPVAVADKRQEAYRVASEMFRQKPDWVMFFREVLGVDGVISRLFPTSAEKQEFERTEEYARIQQMLAKLREKRQTGRDEEPTRVITVRMPSSLHESLRAEAHCKQTSMNKLCISKLLQVIDDGLIPAEILQRKSA